MADVTPGLQTSEGKLAVVGTVLGVLGAVVPPLWTALTDIAAQYPQVRWIALAASAAGMITTALVSMGYAKSRATVKAAASSPPAAGFSRPWALVGLAMLATIGCAALSHVSGSTGTVSLGDGVTCTMTALDTDRTACVKEVKTSCDGRNGFHNETLTRTPVQRLTDGSCP